MTTRLQTLRSSTPGQAPASGSRLPGELWLNFADLQLGMIDASKNAQRLVAVRYFSTGANYAVGDFVIQAGALYVAATAISSSAFVPSQWTKIATAADMSGSNRLLNGDMRIDQRNNGAAITPTGSSYTVDRWKLGMSQLSKINAQRGVLGAGMIAQGWPYALNVSTAAAYTPAASEAFVLFQPIEADMISDFAWGTAGAQPATLSFMALGSIAGTYGGSIRNTDNSRSYPFSFALAASAWTKVVVAIPGDTAGTWVLSDSGVGLTVGFDLGANANLRGPANAWASANYSGVTGAVSMVANAGASMSFTGVKLEIGSTATLFNRQSLAKSMADCQRYYQVGQLYSVASGQVGGQSMLISSLCPIQMRANATMVITTNGSSNISSLVLAHNGLNFNVSGSVGVTGLVTLNAIFSASAEL